MPFFALSLLVPAQHSLARDWKVFCIPEKHLDVGWSFLPSDAPGQGYPGSVEEYQVFSLARALAVREWTANYPPDAQYRWFVDSAWQLEQAEKFRPNIIGPIRRLINAGEWSYNPIYANLHTLCISHEQLMRMMAYGRWLETHGFRRSRVASASDAFSVGWGYASALASAGIQYFIKGTWYTGPSVRPGISMVQPAPLFRWVGPDGKKVLFYYYDSYTVMADGRQWGESLSEATVSRAVQKYELLNREGKWPYDCFPMFGSEGDWGVPDIGDSDFIREWNKSHPSVQLIMSTPERFFEYIEEHFAEKIPEARGGWGVSHDVEEATVAKPGARARANDELLLTAEAFASILPPDARTDFTVDAMRQSWLKQVLYHEHSFGIRDSGPSPDSRRQYVWKNRLTEQVEGNALGILNSILHALVSRISGGGDTTFAVCNALSFPWSDVAEISLDAAHAAGTVRVVDEETRQELPSEIRRAEGNVTVRFRTRAVPAIGYSSVRLEPGIARSSPAVKADARARTLENEYYRLSIAADGSMAGLFDKELKVELVDTASAYRMNQFLFKDDEWHDHSPRGAEIMSEGDGVVSASLKSVAALGIFPRSTQTYTLHAGLKRLDIANSFTKEPGRTKSAETVFYAFPFAVSSGVFHVDIPGVVARYPDEFRPETEWTYMPAQSFISASNDRISITLATREAPNFAFRSMRKFFDHQVLPDLANSTAFAMPLTKQSVNRHDYDYAGGTYEFHYALTSAHGPFRAVDALRFGWGFRRQLQIRAVPKNKGGLPVSDGYLQVDPVEVLISALKPADDGRGVIARLWNPANRSVSARLSLPHMRITAAMQTDLLERDTGSSYEVSDGSIVVPCGAREFVTIRLIDNSR